MRTRLSAALVTLALTCGLLATAPAAHAEPGPLDISADFAISPEGYPGDMMAYTRVGRYWGRVEQVLPKTLGNGFGVNNASSAQATNCIPSSSESAEGTLTSYNRTFIDGYCRIHPGQVTFTVGTTAAPSDSGLWEYAGSDRRLFTRISKSPDCLSAPRTEERRFLYALTTADINISQFDLNSYLCVAQGFTVKYMNTRGVNASYWGRLRSPWTVFKIASMSDQARATNVHATPGDARATITWDFDRANLASMKFVAHSYPQDKTCEISGATGCVISGLTNGTQYAVTVVATNSVGNSGASNSVNGTPNPPARAAVTGLTATPVTGGVDLSWTAPTGTAPNSYNVVVEAAGTPIAGSPFNTANTNYSVTSLTAGTSYTFTVTPQHTSPYYATSASVSAVPLASQVITSTITVTRPVGALVLTQRCGVHGVLPIEPASFGFLELPQLAATISQVGTAPTTGGSADPSFGEYPYPVDGDNVPNAVYPTNCGLDLGKASLVTTGDAAGQYFAISGSLDQISVVDTRDTDAGWSLTGSITDFTKGSDSFSGNYLGWTPVVTDDSDATMEGYDQTVAAGTRVLPDDAVGLSSPKVLASAAAGAGLGIARLDARLRLLIPVTANNGVYSATLTFTII